MYNVKCGELISESVAKCVTLVNGSNYPSCNSSKNNLTYLNLKQTPSPLPNLFESLDLLGNIFQWRFLHGQF